MIEYEYVSAEYAVDKLGDAALYTDKDAIFIYTNNDIAIVLWVMSNENGNYSFKLNHDGTDIVSTPYIVGGVSDQKKYIGTYIYGSSNTVVINNDGTAKFTLNGDEYTYKYLVANSEYIYRWFDKEVADISILLYEENSNKGYIFEMKNGNIFVDEYEFVKS